MDKANATLGGFIEEQTLNAFIPFPMKRHRRYYRTSKPLFTGPYVIPPGLGSLTVDKASESRKCSVVIPHSLVSSFEAALSGMGEAISWIDWWLSTMSKFGESLSKDAHSNFQRLIVSGAKTLEFVANFGVRGQPDHNGADRPATPAQRLSPFGGSLFGSDGGTIQASPCPGSSITSPVPPDPPGHGPQ